MTDTNVDILVKLLSGAQAGAELALPPGDYVLGSDETADLVLFDAAVRPKHARITVAANGATIVPLDNSPVTVNGERVTATTILHDYDVAGMGGVYLAAGPDAAWPAIPAIPLPNAMPQAAPASLSAGPANAHNRPRPSAKDNPKRYGWLLPVLLFALAMLAGAAGAGWYAYQSVFSRSPGEKLAGLLLGQGVPALYVSSSDVPALAPGQVGLTDAPGGGFILRGMVRDDEVKRAIRNSPALTGIAVSDELKSLEAEIAPAAGAVEAKYPWAKLSAARNGYFAVLSGLAPKPEDAHEAYRLARSSLDERIGIRRIISDWADVRRDAEAQASRLGLEKSRFSLKGGEIAFVSPTWPGNEQREDLLAFLDSRYGDSIAALFEQALDKEPEPPALPNPPPLPELLAALSPLPVITPEPEPGLKPEPEPEPVPELKTEPQPEPVVGQKPVVEEPVTASVPESAAPSPRTWLIQWITPEGFVDQNGKHHKAGDYLSSNVRLVNSWESGVVFQRGRETLFGGQGAVISDLTPEKPSALFEKGDATPTS